MVYRRLSFHKEGGHTKSSKQVHAAVLEIATDGFSISYVSLITLNLLSTAAMYHQDFHFCNMLFVGNLQDGRTTPLGAARMVQIYTKWNKNIGYTFSTLQCHDCGFHTLAFILHVEQP